MSYAARAYVATLFGYLLGAVGDVPPGDAHGPWTAWPDPDSAVIVGTVAAVGMLLTGTTWGRFAFARAYLALGGRAPWRLMTFLADARDRGVLRQVGAAYAFRHERLRARLLRGPDPARPVVPADAPRPVEADTDSRRR